MIMPSSMSMSLSMVMKLTRKLIVLPIREKIISFTSTLVDDGGLMITMMITMKMIMMLFLFSTA